MPHLSDPVTIAALDGARCCSFSADGQVLAVGLVVSFFPLSVSLRVPLIKLLIRNALGYLHSVSALLLPVIFFLFILLLPVIFFLFIEGEVL